MDWKPIETAPKGEDILLYCNRFGVRRGHWDDTRYHKKPKPYWTNDIERIYGTREIRDDQPTHWMPLPAPPEQK